MPRSRRGSGTAAAAGRRRAAGGCRPARAGRCRAPGAAARSRPGRTACGRWRSWLPRARPARRTRRSAGGGPSPRRGGRGWSRPRGARHTKTAPRPFSGTGAPQSGRPPAMLRRAGRGRHGWRAPRWKARGAGPAQQKQQEGHRVRPTGAGCNDPVARLEQALPFAVGKQGLLCPGNDSFAIGPIHNGSPRSDGVYPRQAGRG